VTAPAPRTTRTLQPYVRRQWFALVVAALSTVVLAAADAAGPLPFKYVVDTLLPSDSPDFKTKLVEVGAVALLIALANAVATYQSDLRLEIAGESIIHELRLAIYAQLQRLSLSFHQRLATGDLVTRITGDVNAIGDFFASSLGTFVSSGLMLVAYAAVSIYINPLMALVVFSVAPVLGLLTFWFRRRAQKTSRRQRAREGEIASMGAEVLGAMREVQAFGSESYEHERLRAKSEERWRAGVLTSRLEGRFAGLVDFTGAAGAAIVLVVGAWQVHVGSLTKGGLIVMVTYSAQIYKPLRDMARQASRMAKAMACADRIAEILSADEVLVDRAGAHSTGRAVGEVQFDRVVFGYTPERPTLKGLSMLVPAGQRVALIGRSGAGKSTIAALITRFYDPFEGRVTIDGRDVRDCSLRWLRGQVGMVLQESVLFTGTIAENIAYGVDATPEQVVEAARAAGADAFISQLPDGYETVLGQRGVGLSGGQRQRISIARTLLRNPAILVLDEPTTGLDAASEAEVMRGLETLMRGRTTIMVTHSAALARSADRVIEIDAGQIARQGSPAELAGDMSSFRAGESARGSALVARHDPPGDDALPQVGRMLDPDEMAIVLRRSLGWDAPVREVRIHGVRYRPRRSLVAHYDVTIGDELYDAVAIVAARRDVALWARDPSYVRLAEMVNGRAPARQPLSYDPELQAMIQWLPLDITMPGLAEHPDQLRVRLQAAGVAIGMSGERIRLLGYEPRRRAVLRLDGHVLKIYAEEADFAAARAAFAWLDTLGGVRSPPCEGVVADIKLTSQAYVEGTKDDALATAVDAGALLARLHGAEAGSLGALGPADQLRAAAVAAQGVIAVAPELEPTLEGVLSKLEAMMPDAGDLVPTHGGFGVDELIVHDGSLVVLDFDHACLAQPARDVASYASRLVCGGPADLAQAAAALDGLVDGYRGRPRALGWYMATSILQRASVPFQRHLPEWFARTQTMLSDAEEALHL
jgi:ATP-binding cassette subfamily B protein